MDRNLLLHWAFVVGLIGGILIFLGGVLMTLMMSMMGMMMGSMPMGDESMMNHMGGMWGGWAGMGLWMLIWSAVVGTVALIAAVQIRSTRSTIAWGVVLAIAGVLSFPVMGGFLVGGLATIAAGVLALVAASPAPAGGGSQSG